MENTLSSHPIAEILSAIRKALEPEATNSGGQELRVEKVNGGGNNALYRVEAGQRAYAVKLCVPDDRRRAYREYTSLRLLQLAGLDAAPQPLWLDENPTGLAYPLVVTTWLPGHALAAPVSQAQLEQLVEQIKSFHKIEPDLYPDIHLPEAVLHSFDFGEYREVIDDLARRYLPWFESSCPGGAELRQRVEALMHQYQKILAQTRVDPRRGAFPVGLVRVDPNGANIIDGPDERLRWVDWEYSGWGDPAFDLAELRWHAGLEMLTPEQRLWLRQNYPLPAADPHFWERLEVWDLGLGLHWIMLMMRALWSEANGPDRLRLNTVRYGPEVLHQRLAHFLEEAERDWV